MAQLMYRKDWPSESDYSLHTLIILQKKPTIRLRKLKEHDPPIPVFFGQERLNTLDSTGNIILFVLAMVAEEESRMKSEAMLLSLEWRFSRGRFITPVLLGYINPE